MNFRKQYNEFMLLKRLTAFFLDITEVVVFAIAIFLFVYLLILQPHKIKGDSMVPNFLDGEYLLTDKITYRIREPARGDVVVFEAPGAGGDEFIKRIIGLPNEKISLNNGYIFINEQKLGEAYIPETVNTQGGNFIKDDQEIIVPNESYFVMGDNRAASSDSRTWGFISKAAISGKAWVIYWPPSKVGVIERVTYKANN